MITGLPQQVNGLLMVMEALATSGLSTKLKFRKSTATVLAKPAGRNIYSTEPVRSRAASGRGKPAERVSSSLTASLRAKAAQLATKIGTVSEGMLGLLSQAASAPAWISDDHNHNDISDDIIHSCLQKCREPSNGSAPAPLQLSRLYTQTLAFKTSASWSSLNHSSVNPSPDDDCNNSKVGAPHIH
nr:hypothetical protein CFP56_13476 [Quercus suber]